MIDARNVYRKVTRKINDFSPEQLANIAAIVWLYRGQRERFLTLVKHYFGRTCKEIAEVPGKLEAFETTLASMRENVDAAAKSVTDGNGKEDERSKALADCVKELRDAVGPYEKDRARLLADLATYRTIPCKSLPATNEKQHSARKVFDPIAERIKGLIKQVDLVYKLAARAAEAAGELSINEAAPKAYDRRNAGRQLKQLDEGRKAAVEQLKQSAYFHRQIVWLQDRFAKAELEAVPGLVKVVDRSEIEAADWSLTPGRYVGVAPVEVDEDFDFAEALREIHVELEGLNAEAVDLAATIKKNFEELGV
jgi:type I restriction enzyme M protein